MARPLLVKQRAFVFLKNISRILIKGFESRFEQIFFRETSTEEPYRADADFTRSLGVIGRIPNHHAFSWRNFSKTFYGGLKNVRMRFGFVGVIR